MTPEEVLEHETALRVELRGDLDDRWREETVDAGWSRGIEASIEDVFSEWVTRGEVAVDVSCHAHTCRTVLSHAQTSQQQLYLQALIDEYLPLEHHFFYEKGRLVIYSLNVRD